jgi:hypothetical protein
MKFTHLRCNHDIRFSFDCQSKQEKVVGSGKPGSRDGECEGNAHEGHDIIYNTNMSLIAWRWYLDCTN